MSETAANPRTSTFLTIVEWKAQVGSATSEMQVLRNSATGKLFLSFEGENYRVQGDLDPALPMKMLIPESGDISDSCLINYDASKGAEVFVTL